MLCESGTICRVGKRKRTASKAAAPSPGSGSSLHSWAVGASDLLSPRVLGATPQFCHRLPGPELCPSACSLGAAPTPSHSACFKARFQVIHLWLPTRHSFATLRPHSPRGLCQPFCRDPGHLCPSLRTAGVWSFPVHSSTPRDCRPSGASPRDVVAKHSTSVLDHTHARSVDGPLSLTQRLARCEHPTHTRERG